MAWRVRQGEIGPCRQILDTPLALAEMFEQFQAMRVTECLCNLGEAGEYTLFRTHAWHLMLSEDQSSEWLIKCWRSRKPIAALWEVRMILRQFLHSDPVGISYLFGCGGHAACAVVDPVGDVAPYLRVADNTGMRIRFVIDSHIHADHRSAGRALASEAGAEYVLHAGAEVAFPFHAVKDGDRLPLGNVVVDVMHTPGHTPEHIWARLARWPLREAAATARWGAWARGIALALPAAM
jgi:hypothetical protein